MLKQQGILDDPLFGRFFLFLSGLYPLSLAVLIITMSIVKPLSSWWQMLLCWSLAGLFAYAGLYLIVLACARRGGKERDLSQWFSGDGLDIFGFLLFVLLLILAGIFAYILTAIIRFFVPRPKYRINLDKTK